MSYSILNDLTWNQFYKPLLLRVCLVIKNCQKLELFLKRNVPCEMSDNTLWLSKYNLTFILDTSKTIIHYFIIILIIITYKTSCLLFLYYNFYFYFPYSYIFCFHHNFGTSRGLVCRNVCCFILLDNSDI